MKHFINLFLLLVPIVTISAQKTIDNGYVKLEITEVASDDPNTAAQLEMMKGMTTELFFSKEKYKTTMTMMGGMIRMNNIVDVETKNIDMLIDAMGQKLWVNTNTDKAKEGPGAQDMSDFKVEYDKTKTKDILGYSAYSATITSESNPGMTIEGWVTEDIKTDANIIQGMDDLKLQGFPLQFSVINSGATLTFSATEIKESVDDSVFVLKTDGYQKLTPEEFQEMMGAFGGGMGF